MRSRAIQLGQGVRTALAAVFWAIRFELVIRRKRLDELAALAGIRLETTTQPDSRLRSDLPRGPVVSPADLRTLELAWALYRPWPGGGTCLRECLVAGRLLRYREPVLRVGVRRGPGRIEVHAWLEFDGVAVDPSAHMYRPLVGR